MDASYHAKNLWNYHKLNQKIDKSDLIIGLGGHDIRVAERSAELYLQNYAPLIIFTGKGGNWRVNEHSHDKDITEAQRFKNTALLLGVPENSIILEDKSTSTGENIKFTKEILRLHKIKADKVILVNQPYMERRTYATFKAQWPELNFVVTSPQHSFEDFPIADITLEKIIHKMVSDLQRIIEYPKRGFQIEQEIPDNVMDSYNELIKQGFTNAMMKNPESY